MDARLHAWRAPKQPLLKLRLKLKRRLRRRLRLKPDGQAPGRAETLDQLTEAHDGAEGAGLDLHCVDYAGCHGCCLTA